MLNLGGGIPIWPSRTPKPEPSSLHHDWMASQVGDLPKVTLQVGTAQVLSTPGGPQGVRGGGPKVDFLAEVSAKPLLAKQKEGLSETCTQDPGGGAPTPKCIFARDLGVTTISVNLHSGRSPRPPTGSVTH